MRDWITGTQPTDSFVGAVVALVCSVSLFWMLHHPGVPWRSTPLTAIQLVQGVDALRSIRMETWASQRLPWRESLPENETHKKESIMWDERQKEHDLMTLASGPIHPWRPCLCLGFFSPHYLHQQLPFYLLKPVCGRSLHQKKPWWMQSWRRLSPILFFHQQPPLSFAKKKKTTFLSRFYAISKGSETG